MELLEFQFGTMHACFFFYRYSIDVTVSPCITGSLPLLKEDCGSQVSIHDCLYEPKVI